MAHDVLRQETLTAQPLRADGPVFDLDRDQDGHDHDDLTADMAPDHSAMAPYVDDDHDEGAAKGKRKAAGKKKSVVKRAKKVAKDIAHKTQAPKVGTVDAATQALLDQALAINNKLIADTQKVVKDSDAKRAKEELRQSINDSKAMAYGVELAMYSRMMGGAGSKAFIQRLDSIDDADLRKKVKAQFAKQTGQSLEQFIKTNDEWNNAGENRDKHAALQLIDEKRDVANDAIRAMDPQQRAEREKAANDAAIEIIAGTVAHDHSDANQQRIFRALQGRDPVDVELIRAAVRKHTHGESNLYQAIDNGTHEGNEDQAVAMLAGDRVASARAAFKNERDPARLREVLKQLKPEERMQLSPFGPQLVAGVTNPSDRAELVSLMFNNPAAADAERLGNLLKPETEGMPTKFGDMKRTQLGIENAERRQTSNVLKEFEAMSAAEVKAAAEKWDELHPGRPFTKMIAERWGDDEDSDKKARLLAMVEGDKGKARSVRLQEAMRTGNQKEIEAALAHDKVSDDELNSPDAAVRARAQARQAKSAAENESFERNNQIASEAKQRVAIFNGSGGDFSAIAGVNTSDQIDAHYAAQARKQVGESKMERIARFQFGAATADARLLAKQKKHDTDVKHHHIAAREVLEDGKLSKGTELHRAKTTKEKAELLESIDSAAELEKAKESFKAYDGKELLPYVDKPRADMNANELMIDNVRLYGVRSERPAQVEYLLQVQQYKKQYSAALEVDEADEAGGGSQRWQRQELAAQRDLLKDPKVAVSDPTLLGGGVSGAPRIFVESGNDPSFADIEKLLPYQGSKGEDGKKLDDGLKDGVSKAEYSMLDKGMTEANKTQADAKKRLADRITSMISTIAKIAALLTLNPALIALINLGEGLVNIAVKAQVMGEAYDPTLDAKMVGFTLMADVALMGFSHLGKAAGGAIRQQVGGAVKQQAVQAAERKIVHSAENAVKNKVLDEGAAALAHAAKVEAGYNLVGSAVKHTISTVGGGVVKDKSNGDIAQEYLFGLAGLVVPNALSSRAKSAFGTESLAQRVMGTAAESATDVVANTALSMAGGKDAGDSLLDAALDHGKGRVHSGIKAYREKRAAESEATTKAATEQAEATTKTEDDPSKAADDALTSHASAEAAAAKAIEPPPADESARPTQALDENYQPIAATTDDAASATTRQMPVQALDENYQPIAAHERVTEQMAVPTVEQAAHERTTQQMTVPAVEQAAHERTTQQMAVPAVEQNSAHQRVTQQLIVPGVAEAAHSTIANSPAQEAHQANVDQATSLQERIDRATGVSRGDVEQRRKDWEAMYAQQEVESKDVVTVDNRMIEARTDGGWYEGYQNYDARRFTYDNGVLTSITVDGHIAAGPGVSQSEVDAAKQATFSGTDQIINSNGTGKRHRLPDGSHLHVEPVFHDNAGDAKHLVELRHPEIDPTTGLPVAGTTNQRVWRTNDVTPQVAVHEFVGHGTGQPDTYVDPMTYGRATPTSPGVTNNGSFMQTVDPADSPRMTPEHLQQFGRDIADAEAGRSGGVQYVPHSPPLATPLPQPTPAPMPHGEPEPDLATQEAQADESDRTRTRTRDELDADSAPDLIHTEHDQRTTPIHTEDDTNGRLLNGQVPEEQVSFLNGERVPYGTPGSVRPDGFVIGASTEAKNYGNLHQTEQQYKLVANIAKQAGQRDKHLPPGTDQHVTIDVRGQDISDEVMTSLRIEIAAETKGSIPADRITFLTDDGDNTLEAVNDPMDRQGNFRD